jgi:hypothetical protein
MSETKRVPTWSDIHEAEAALRTFDGAAAMAAKVMSVFDGEDTIEEALSSVETENVCVARAIRKWCRKAREERELADLERKKAGLS